MLLLLGIPFTQTDLLAQGSPITGKVVNAESQLPMSAVTVALKGSNRGALTDSEGNFRIQAQAGETLIFSYIGMKTQEVVLETETALSVALEADDVFLKEVVVVGYGTQKKSDITGSVASFDPEVLANRPQTNLVQALQGNIAGVTVSTASSSAEDRGAVLVRGQNSITASNSPLIVLDGIPYNGSLSEINPNDVERMEILKDASSTAIYGSRGANGVILITTKGGRAGKNSVSYNGYYSFDEIASLPDMQNGAQFWNDNWERSITNTLSLPSNSLSISQVIDLSFFGNETNITDLGAFMEGYPGQNWDEFKEGILANYPEYTSDREILLQLAQEFAYPEGGRDTDWISLATRSGHRQEHNFSVSGGTEKLTYFVSATHTDIQGIAKGDDFSRSIIRFNLTFQLAKGLTYGTNSQIGFFDRSGIPAEWGSSKGAFRLSPLYNGLNEDGSIDLSPIDEDGSVRNPMEPLRYINENKETRVITNHFVNLEVPKVPGLAYKLNFGYQTNAGASKTYLGQNTVTGAIQNGRLSITHANGNSWTLENILSYRREFGRHSLFLTGLYSAQQKVAETDMISGRGFPSDVMTYYQAANAELLVGDARYTRSSYLSQMFRANYVFDDRYLFTATVRRDGFSAFGTNSKFGVFPSVAVGWNLANERFLNFGKTVDAWKLRLSYGESGNEAVSPYSKLPVMSVLNYISPDEQTLFGYFPETLANPDLSWETTKSLNAGTDFSLWNGRVSGTIDAFVSNTFDLLLSETISSVNGTNRITRNIGETRNRGLEFQLGGFAVQREQVDWKINLIGSRFRSEIVQVGLKNEEGQFIDDVASEWFIGQPVNVFFDYTLDRILQQEDFQLDDMGNYLLDNNGNYQLLPEVAEQIVQTTPTVRPGQPIIKDINRDGTIGGAEDKIIYGNENPDFTLGLTQVVNVKNWTLSVFVNGVWGVTKPNSLINNNGLGPRRKLNLDYWTPENPTNELPGINKGSLTPSIDLFPYANADYIRIQDISLAYRIPSKLPLSQFEVYANIRNLYTFTEWAGIDPDYNVRGEGNDIPRARSYIIGVRITY
jgi:TonB-linked SusC/RagA family outer membrane protein